MAGIAVQLVIECRERAEIVVQLGNEYRERGRDSCAAGN